MGRLLTRITIVLVAIYFIVAHIYAQFFGIDILDYRFDFIGVNAYNAIPIAIIALSITYAIYKAIRHYVIVRKIKRRKSTYA
jgi:hypothetical protein